MLRLRLCHIFSIHYPFRELFRFRVFIPESLPSHSAERNKTAFETQILQTFSLLPAAPDGSRAVRIATIYSYSNQRLYHNTYS